MSKNTPHKIICSLKPCVSKCDSLKLSDYTDALEKVVISEALERSKGVIGEAARVVGINWQTLKKLIGKHGLNVDDFKPTVHELAVEHDKRKVELERIFEKNGRDVKKAAAELNFSVRYFRELLADYEIHHMSRSRRSAEPELDGLGDQPDDIEFDDALHSIGIRN